MTLSGVKAFTSILFARARLSGKLFFAPPHEAEQRAKICSTCPLNNKSQCSVCGGLLALVRKLVGRRETSYDSLLGVCSLCGCLLRAKVHVSAEVLRMTPTVPAAEDVPEQCWLRGIYGSALK